MKPILKLISEYVSALLLKSHSELRTVVCLTYITGRKPPNADSQILFHYFRGTK